MHTQPDEHKIKDQQQKSTSQSKQSKKRKIFRYNLDLNVARSTRFANKYIEENDVDLSQINQKINQINRKVFKYTNQIKPKNASLSCSLDEQTLQQDILKKLLKAQPDPPQELEKLKLMYQNNKLIYECQESNEQQENENSENQSQQDQILDYFQKNEDQLAQFEKQLKKKELHGKKIQNYNYDSFYQNSKQQQDIASRASSLSQTNIKWNYMNQKELKKIFNVQNQNKKYQLHSSQQILQKFIRDNLKKNEIERQVSPQLKQYIGQSLDILQNCDNSKDQYKDQQSKCKQLQQSINRSTTVWQSYLNNKESDDEENVEQRIQSNEILHNYLNKQILDCANQNYQKIKDMPSFLKKYYKGEQHSREVKNPVAYNQLLNESKIAQVKKFRINTKNYLINQEKQMWKTINLNDYIGFK